MTLRTEVAYTYPRMTDTSQHRKHTKRRIKVKATKFFVRIPDEMRDDLETIAVREERNLSQVARLAFRDFIEKRAATV